MRIVKNRQIRQIKTLAKFNTNTVFKNQVTNARSHIKTGGGNLKLMPYLLDLVPFKVAQAVTKQDKVPEPSHTHGPLH